MRITVVRHFALPLVVLLASVLFGCENPLQVGLGDEVDMGPPEISLASPAPDAYLRGTVTLSGVATDDHAVSRVEISHDRGSTWANVTAHNPPRGEWSHTLNTTARPDGRLSVTLRATDTAGKMHSSDERLFTIDNTPPVALVTGPRNASDLVLTTRAVLTVAAADVHPIIRFGVDVHGAVPTEQYYAGSVEPADLEWARLPGYPKIYAQNASPWTFVFDSRPHTTDKKLTDGTRDPQPHRFFRFDVWAEDEAGNRSTDFFVADDVAAINNNVDLTVDQIAALFHGETIAMAGGGTLTSADVLAVVYPRPGRTLMLEFDDVWDASKARIAYSTAPVIEFISPVLDALAHADFVITGTASVANGLLTADLGAGDTEYVLVRPDGVADWASAVQIPVTGGAWSYPVTGLFDRTADGPKTVAVRATDRFGDSTTQPFSFTVDTVPPTVTVSQPVSDAWLSGASSGVSGAASDTNGIARVRFWAGAIGITPPADPEEWSLASGTWNGTMDLTGLGEGEKELHVRALDGAGNWSVAVTRTFGIDQNEPTVAETLLGAASVDRNEVFSIGGTATDTNALASIRVTQRRGTGSTVVVLDDKPLFGTYETWSLTGLPRAPDAADPTDPLAVQLADGVYNYAITVHDVSGKTHQINRSVTVDVTGPVVRMATPSNAQIVSGTAFSASGTAADVADISAITDVRYWVGELGAEPPSEFTTWRLASGTAAWTVVLDLGALGEGRKTLHVVGRDAAGNWSEEIATRSFVVDQSPPTVSETTVGTGTVFRNAAFSLEGTAADTNELASIAVTQDGVKLETVALAGRSDTWKVSGLPRDPDNVGETLVADGLVSFTIRVTDIAGRTVETTRTVTVDATDPTIAIESLARENVQ